MDPFPQAIFLAAAVAGIISCILAVFLAGVAIRESKHARRADNLRTEVPTGKAEELADPPAGVEVYVNKLPRTGKDLFGREGELASLDKAWKDGGTNLVSLVAMGGAGKSAVATHWLGRMARNRYRSAKKVFGWSFYSQGTSDTAASADAFMEKALDWFGYTGDRSISGDQKGLILAGLVQKTRTLLILDGMEPIQYPPGFQEGRIKDPGLRELVQTLAVKNPGLCLITTRVEVADVADYQDSTAPAIELGPLADEAGADVLRSLGIEGGADELKEVSRKLKGHGLSLNLLGTYLKAQRGGRLEGWREEVALLKGAAASHAENVMKAYVKWLGEGPELAVLRMAGLFDRPASGELVRALRRAPAIWGLTDPLFGSPWRRWAARLTPASYRAMNGEAWRNVLARLRAARLLLEEDPEDREGLDAHPLVREYFGKRLREESPGAWRKAHLRLYEHLTKTADEFPETAEAMAPLFAAVAHGCAAGRHQEAFKEVYRRRIKRGSEFFSTKKLGLFGSELAALSGFFAEPWTRAVDALTEDDKGFVLNGAGFGLRALGRLAEAAQPMRASLDMDIAREDWKSAAIVAGNLSELHLARGAVADAVAVARRSVELAGESDDAFQRMARRTTLADALHQAGDLEEAADLFREAVAMQKYRQLQYPLLYSVQGFRYCDLLLERGEHAAARQRAGKTLEWATEEHLLLDIALDTLTLGRAALAEAAARGANSLEEAERRLDDAVEGLRRAGRQDYIPNGLLARAALWRCMEDPAKARRDLDEALRIAIRSGMRLHEADAHLEYARLHLAGGDSAAAREPLAKAKAIVAETGYRRRAPEVAELQERLG